MRQLKIQTLFFLSFLIPVVAYAADFIKVDFTNETVGAPAKDFSSFVGKWHIDKDGTNLTYAVDGRKWAQGTMSAGIADKAKTIYGERYAEFLDNLEAYKYFPLSIYKGLDNFKDGTISVAFKSVSGRIDQGAGIAFNIKPNGDYLVLRANPLEKNIVVFKMERGRRSSVQWIRNIPMESNEWYTLKVSIKGTSISGYLDNKKYVNLQVANPIEGKIGLWSKSDSYVFFDDFQAEQIKK